MDKIRRIFPLLILFTLLSCADTIETRIPYRAVYLELDLTYQDKALKAILAYKIYTPKNVDQANEQTGFGGVLVYHGLPDAFFAFDTACPHEASSNTIVEIDESGMYAICRSVVVNLTYHMETAIRWKDLALRRNKPSNNMSSIQTVIKFTSIIKFFTGNVW